MTAVRLFNPYMRYTLAELQSLPTLCVGQADDLKIEAEYNGTEYQVWLSRCTVADGEPFDNKVTVMRRRRFPPSWVVWRTYPAEVSW